MQKILFIKANITGLFSHNILIKMGGLFTDLTQSKHFLLSYQSLKNSANIYSITVQNFANMRSLITGDCIRVLMKYMPGRDACTVKNFHEFITDFCEPSQILLILLWWSLSFGFIGKFRKRDMGRKVLYAILQINLNMLIYKKNSIKLSNKEIKIHPLMVAHELQRKIFYRECNCLKYAFLFLFIS